MNMSGVASGAGMSGMAGCSGSHSQMAGGATNKNSETRKTTPTSKGQTKNLNPNLGGIVDVGV